MTRYLLRISLIAVLVVTLSVLALAARRYLLMDENLHIRADLTDTYMRAVELAVSISVVALSLPESTDSW